MTENSVLMKILDWFKGYNISFSVTSENDRYFIFKIFDSFFEN